MCQRFRQRFHGTFPKPRDDLWLGGLGKEHLFRQVEMAKPVINRITGNHLAR